jgi:predicted membrane channel-forming protein YqfA (hemolysin III family)
MISNEYLHENTDGRLFCNEVLYCEGRKKPYLRGKLHLVLLICFPPLFWWYYEASKENLNGLYICYFYLLMNVITFVISSLYHVGTWSKETEIILQKIDHIMVASYVCSKYFPMALLLVPKEIGLPHFFAALMITIWNNYNVIIMKPNTLRLVALAGIQLPFMYWYHEYMNELEWNMNWLAIVSQSIAGYFFINEFTPSWFNPDVATFHEIYHLISFITGAAMWIMNWSILRRTSNATENEIL